MMAGYLVSVSSSRIGKDLTIWICGFLSSACDVYSESGEDGSFDEDEFALSLQAGDCAVERNEEAHVAQEECIVSRVGKSAFPTDEFEYFLHIHSRGSGVVGV
jgi:hypothetical protein